MSNFIKILISASVILFASCGQQVADPVDLDLTVRNFGLYDHEDGFHRLHYYNDAPAVVIYVQGNGCPIVRKSIATFEELRADYEKQGVKFFMINSNMQDTRASIAEEAEAFNITTPVLVDEDQLVAEILDINITAETFVIDPANWSVLYRGPIDDQLGYGADKGNAKEHYVKDILDAKLGVQKIAHVYRKAKGCAVSRLSHMESYDNLTYDDVAPIFRDHCYSCHQDGGIAPWPMNGYPIGSKRGEGEDILAELQPNPSEWKLGSPDFVFKLKQEDIPANGIIDYRYQTHEVVLEEDKYVSALEVKPGNPNVLHHVLASIDYPKGYEAPVDRKVSRWIDGLLIGWAPGGEAERFPEGTGRLLPAGSKVVFQLHYTTSGKAESDETEIGLYFHDDAPDQEYVVLGPVNFQFKIPPRTKHHPVVAKYPIKRLTKIHAVLPHMHYRGKSMNYVAHYPDGTEEMMSLSCYR